MKKLLIATTALVATAGMAAADVTVSGSARFGLAYNEDILGAGTEETTINSRLTLDFNATTETDVGVTFGAQLRMRHNNGSASTAGNQARFWIGYEGLTVEVGNVNTAWDSVGLTYGSEMGFEDSSFGDAIIPAFAYNSTGPSHPDYTGIAATYSISGVNLYFSYVDANQTVGGGVVKGMGSWEPFPGIAIAYPITEEEIGIAADWTNGQITLAGAYNKNTGGIDGVDALFLGGAYNFGDGNVGLNIYKYDGIGSDLKQYTLYGDYTFGATTVQAYVSDIDLSGLDTSYGLGASYSLGEGASLKGSIQSGYLGENKADLGVQFAF